MRHAGLKVRMALTVGVLLVVYYFVAGTLAMLVDPVVPGGENGAFVAAVAATLGLMAVQQYVGTRVTLEAVGAEPLDPERYPEVYERTEELATSMELPMPTLMVADIGAPNAFAIGRKGDGYVVLSESLLDMLETGELAGVLGHELAHLDNHDVVVMSIANSIIWLAATLTKYLTIALITVMAFVTEFMTGLMGSRRQTFDWARIQAVVVPSVTLLVLLFITLFQRALSRHREYVADAQSARHTGDPDAMASALRTISRADHPEADDAAGELSALFIFGESEGLLSKAFADHPAMDKRIEVLRSMNQGAGVEGAAGEQTVGRHRRDRQPSGDGKRGDGQA